MYYNILNMYIYNAQDARLLVLVIFFPTKTSLHVQEKT